NVVPIEEHEGELTRWKEFCLFTPSLLYLLKLPNGLQKCKPTHQYCGQPQSSFFLTNLYSSLHVAGNVEIFIELSDANHRRDVRRHIAVHHPTVVRVCIRRESHQVPNP